jgi:integrase
MTSITQEAGNRYTARHHQRESPALGSARQNRYTDPLHTASAERSHCAATRWLRDGVPIEVVSTLLGHSSVALTSSVYGHLTAEDARAALEKAGWFTGKEVSW